MDPDPDIVSFQTLFATFIFEMVKNDKYNYCYIIYGREIAPFKCI